MATEVMKSNNLSERRFLFIPLRFFKFAVVGGSGVLVNMGVLFVLTEWIGLYYLISSLIAIELSIISNFILNDFWTWGDRKAFTGSNFFTRMIKYNISAGTAAFIGNYFTLILLTELFGLYYILSNLIGIAVGVIINYSLNDRWTYRILDEYIRK